MNKAIKYRIYPNNEQCELFMKTFGCCRKVWNLMLDARDSAYKDSGKVFRPTPAMFKDEYPFLREVDSLALANVQLNLQDAYNRFFKEKGAGHPKFKSRKYSRYAYTTNNQNGTIVLHADLKCIKLPKVGKVKAIIHRMPKADWKLKSATVSMSHDGKFYCSVLFEYEEQVKNIEHPELNAIGLDYKSDGLFVSSSGLTCGSPKYYRKAHDRLTKAQRKLRHKDKNSNNYRKACKKIAKEHSHIANQRKDFLHKQSTEIVNQYDMVCVESLNMRSIANKGFGNGKATLDNGYGMFLNMLEYKLHDCGKVFVKIDKWFPSSQICSCCGTVHPEMKSLSIRKWICPDCGTSHERDENAAINILNEGLRQFLNN